MCPELLIDPLRGIFHANVPQPPNSAKEHVFYYCRNMFLRMEHWWLNNKG